ncbi:MAG: YqhA family protein [Chlorobiaceae bacterium]|nr:YqhA family protein [Chlorobiaceae bacterium]NTV25129.1 YqhA family protein [Chlorobiaceae bacterium]
MHRFFSSSRWLVIIAVTGSFIAGTAMLVFGGFSVIRLLAELLQTGDFGGKAAKTLALGFIEAVDLFLLGTVFQIIAMGLYELFIDDTIPVPSWLVIHTLDDLKSKLLGVVVVVMAVVFLGHVINWHGEQEIIWIGGAIALVVSSMTFFLAYGKKK